MTETPLLGINNSSGAPQTIWIEPIGDHFTIRPGQSLVLFGIGDSGQRPACNVVLWERGQVQVYLESTGDFRVEVDCLGVEYGYQRELSQDQAAVGGVKQPLSEINSPITQSRPPADDAAR